MNPNKLRVHFPRYVLLKESENAIFPGSSAKVGQNHCERSLYQIEEIFDLVESLDSHGFDGEDLLVSILTASTSRCFRSDKAIIADFNKVGRHCRNKIDRVEI